LTFAAIGEAATGLALLIVPSFVGQLLLGEQLTGVAVPVAPCEPPTLLGHAYVSRPEMTIMRTRKRTP